MHIYCLICLLCQVFYAVQKLAGTHSPNSLSSYLNYHVILFLINFFMNFQLRYFLNLTLQNLLISIIEFFFFTHNISPPDSLVFYSTHIVVLENNWYLFTSSKVRPVPFSSIYSLTSYIDDIGFTSK